MSSHSPLAVPGGKTAVRNSTGRPRRLLVASHRAAYRSAGRAGTGSVSSASNSPHRRRISLPMPTVLPGSGLGPLDTLQEHVQPLRDLVAVLVGGQLGGPPGDPAHPVVLQQPLQRV